MHRLAAQELPPGGLSVQPALLIWYGFRVIGYLISKSLHI